ncbi:MAG: alpha/beta fold hydrolase [Polyangiaceae bacterium]|nr:alpha/beta fold hydrolase [Polyangiaceae bacterium]
MSVTERVHLFGEGGALGIVTLPPGDPGTVDAPAAGNPFLVILNAGLVHRIGPFRLSVDLARRLAARGSRVLRLDLPGIGDSPARGGSAPVEGQAVDACREAMNHLAERYGARTFMVGGLCAGAVHAHRVGLADPRVEGVCLLDGYVYPTLISQARRVAVTARRPQGLLSLGRRLATQGAVRLGSILSGDSTPPKEDRSTGEAGDSRVGLFYQSWPPVQSARADIERMLDRGVRFLFVYTGGWSGFNYPGQFDDIFPSLPGRHQITVKYYPDADHTFLTLKDREALFQSVEQFVAGAQAS